MWPIGGPLFERWTGMRKNELRRRNVALSIAADVECKQHQTPPTMITDHDYEICQCLICHETLQRLTHAHAQYLHGYPDKFAMIADGKVRFINKRKNDADSCKVLVAISKFFGGNKPPRGEG